MIRERLALIVVPPIAVAAIALAVVMGRDYAQRTSGILQPQSWPNDLVSLLDDAAESGDTVGDVDVRRVGFITTYAWRMPSSAIRVDLHKTRFSLLEAPPDGPELQALLSHLPRAWPPPTNNVVVYANPLGPSGADDGEHEFVLVNDLATGMLYFFFHFNF